MTPSDITATAEPITLRRERSRLLTTLLVVGAMLIIAVAIAVLAGQVFGPDPMTGT